MTAATVTWLKNILNKLPESMEIYINVGNGKMIPLCKKIDVSTLIYSTREEPDVDRGQMVVTLRPCNHTEEEEDQIKEFSLN